MVVTITRDGFIKRTTLETYRAQNRGGRGRSGASTRGDDIVTRSFNAHTHQWVLFFSSGGKAFREKVWRLPEAGRRPRRAGRWSICCRSLAPTRSPRCCRCRRTRRLWDSLHLMFATASGNVRRNRLSDFRNVRAAGLIAMKLDEGDRLIGVATCREGDDVLLATRAGRCIRFELTDDTVRVFAGRDSSGVRGIRLAEPRRGHEPVGAAPHRREPGGARGVHQDRQRPPPQRRARKSRNRIAAEAEEIEGEVNLTAERIAEMDAAEEMLLTVTDSGFGKRSSAYEYRVTGRGGQGIANITLAPRNGKSWSRPSRCGTATT